MNNNNNNNSNDNNNNNTFSNVSVVIPSKITPSLPVYNPIEESDAMVSCDSNGNLTIHSDTHYGAAKVCEERGIKFMSIVGVIGEIGNQSQQQQLVLNLCSKDAQILMNRHEEEIDSPCYEEFVMACKEDDLDIVKILVESDKVMDPKKVLDATLNQYPIHFAARYGAINILSYLWKNCQVDPNVQSFSGKTALHYAAGDFQVECVKYLLNECKADPSIRENQNYYPIQVMVQPGVESLKSVRLEIIDKIKQIAILLKDQIEHAPPIIQQLVPQIQQNSLHQMELDETTKKDQFMEVQEQEEEDLCMICLENKPNTMVEPCMHIVVCSVCSPLLQQTPDKNTCVKCRCPIERIHYPDEN